MYNPIYPNLQMPNLLSGIQLYSNTTLLPRASSVKEVDETPITTLNSEQVFLNKDDDTIMYIKRVDSAGKVITTRYRFYEDAEPTQQQINDSRYVTIDEFNKLKDEILSSINKNNGKGKMNGSKSTNENVRNSENQFEPKKYVRNDGQFQS